jgi:hypothetical protein
MYQTPKAEVGFFGDDNGNPLKSGTGTANTTPVVGCVDAG